jgi:hypothetical protein
LAPLVFAILFEKRGKAQEGQVVNGEEATKEQKVEA